MPPPKLWVFSTTTAAVDTKYGPAFGRISDAIASTSTRPRSAAYVRVVMPENAAAAPSSARTTCASVSQSSSCPGSTSSRTPSWLAIDPVGVNSAASWPSSSATRRSSSVTVGSSPKTSSPTSAAAIAARMAGVGRVTVSLRRSITSGTRRPYALRSRAVVSLRSPYTATSG